MRISGLPNSIYGRVFTIYERSSQYVYWKQAVATILLGVILAAGTLYSLYQLRGWMIPVGALAIMSIAAMYIRRKRFFSPSSVRLQTTLFLTIKRLRRIWKRDTYQQVRNAIEIRPLVGAVVAPVFCLVAFPTVTAALPHFLQNFTITGGVDETVWVVHATVTGFSFIILIFFWEFLGDEFDNEVFIRTTVRYTWSLHIIYFLLAANVVIGVLAILAQGDQIRSFVGVQSLLFVISIFGVYWIYDTVYSVMVKDTLTPRIKRRLDQQINTILTEPNQEGWMSVVNQQLDQDYPQMALPDFTGKQERMTADDLGLNGKVTDIHLHRLNNLLEEASALGLDIERLPILEQSYHDDDVLFVYKGDLTGQEAERIQNQLRRAVKVI